MDKTKETSNRKNSLHGWELPIILAGHFLLENGEPGF